MSRSGYSDDCEHLELYRGRVARSLGGKRGQRALRDMAEALDAMPVKELAAGSFQRGGVCTLGALAQHRGVDVSDLEPDPYEDGWVDSGDVGPRFDIAPCMAAEVMYENDEAGAYQYTGYRQETPAERWQRMRKWVADNLKETP